MIEHRLLFECDECGNVKGISVDGLKFGGRLDTGYIPDGWSFVRGRLICGEHSVIVKPEENS